MAPTNRKTKSNPLLSYTPMTQKQSKGKQKTKQDSDYYYENEDNEQNEYDSGNNIIKNNVMDSENVISFVWTFFVYFSYFLISYLILIIVWLAYSKSECPVF